MAARNRILCAVLVAILAVGLYDVLVNHEPNGCAMTYMFQYPTYLDVPGLSETVKKAYPRYSLKLYGEGKYAQESRKMKLRGIPVLFIPGNAGSYKQVRSLGSVALRKAEGLGYHFNYFSVDLNEEFSALYGGILQDQTEFVHHCIKHILTLYSSVKNPPSSVLVVGHSMGGLVARALFTLPDFDASLVHTIITQATPHQSPVVGIDREISLFYHRVNEFWRENVNSSLLQHVTVLSVGGGYRDFQVRTGLTLLDGLVSDSRGLSVTASAVPKVWLSTDHLCIVWCKELVLATKRAIFDMVDKQTKKISTDTALRMDIFRHHFQFHSGKDKVSSNSDKAITFEGDKFELVEDGSLRISGSFSKGATHYLFPVEQPNDAFVITANIPHYRWVFVCTQGDTISCSEGVDVSGRGRLIPPLKSGMRELHLDLSEFPQAKHIVVKVTTASKISVNAEMYRTDDRRLTFTLPGLVSGGKLASMVMGDDANTVIYSTEPGASFYNITLEELVGHHQAFTANLTPLKCVSQKKNSNSTLVLYVPWNSEESFSVQSAFMPNSLPIKIHSGRPFDDTRLPQLLAYLDPMCSYKLEVQAAIPDMFGQLVRFHMTLIPCFIVIVIVLVLSYQLQHIFLAKPLESFVWIQSSYCKPFIVVPPIALFRRFFKYDSIDTTFDLRTLEDANISFGMLPMVIFLFGYAVVCIMTSMLSIKLQIGGRIMALFQRTPKVAKKTDKTNGDVTTNSSESVATISETTPTTSKSAPTNSEDTPTNSESALTTSEPASKPETSSEPEGDSNILVGTGISGVLTAIALGTCGTLALLGAVVVYYFRVASLRGQEAFHYHIAILHLLIWLVILNAPSLLVWGQNLRYGLSLPVDPALYISLIICATLPVLLNPKYTVPKTKSIAKGTSWILYLISVLMILYASVSLYRLSYFISAVFVILSTIQVA